MKKHVLAMGLLLMGSVLGMNAQNATAEKAKKDFIETSKIGGYVIGRASFTDKDLAANKPNSNFDLRLVRAYVDGKVLDFAYKLQVEYEGYGTSSEKGPHIVDAWGEWQKYKFFRIKVGQFKRCYTFENPMNPWDISWGDYSQLTSKLAGMNDYLGVEHSSGGRDGGIQFQGDLLPSKKDGHAFVHYQLGIYNGQGINHSDVNNRKDVIGSIAINPIKDLSVAAFYWDGNIKSTAQDKTYDRKRYAFGLKYTGAVKVRAEYGADKDKDGADAWYATAAMPVNKMKNWNVQAKWDVFRNGKEFNKAVSKYCLGSEYYFAKNLKLQANYAFVNDKVSTTHHYNEFNMQMYWRW